MVCSAVGEIRRAVTRRGVDVIGHDGLVVEPMRPFDTLNHARATPHAPATPEECCR
jgi:acyl-CoA dehydrogenase